MFPTRRDEQLRLASRPEGNITGQSYFSLIPPSSSNMSSSSTDTSSGSYESSLSLSSAETQDFRPYKLFESSCNRSLNNSQDKSIFRLSNHSEVSSKNAMQTWETPFSRERTTPRRTIISDGNIKNHHLDLYHDLFSKKETESPAQPTIPTNQGLDRVSDLCLAPSSTPYTANTCLNTWELEVDAPTSKALLSINNDRIPTIELLQHHLNNHKWIDFETLESSTGEPSISKINCVMNVGSFQYSPPLLPNRKFEILNQASGFTGKQHVAQTASLGNNQANYEMQYHGALSSSGVFSASSISPDRNMNSASSNYMNLITPVKNLKNCNRPNQESSRLFSENYFQPTTTKSPDLNKYISQVGSISNSSDFETPNWNARSSSGIFSEPSLSSITSISPGSIGYMPRVSPITNPINFDVLNKDFKLSSGIKADKVCTFCKKNGESQKVYSTHSVKVKVGNRYIVTCPVLRSHVCSMCGEFGDNAHTVTYCPRALDSNKKKPQSTTVTLKSTRMKSNGKKRYNYNNA